METMTLKNIRIVFMAFLVILFSLILTCCSDSNDFSNEIKTENELSVYDENNYDFTTINLWGSEVAVIDKGDYFLFQGDIRIYKEDLFKMSSRGAGILNRSWPNNKVYYLLDNVPSNYAVEFYSAITELEGHSYLTFLPANYYGSLNYVRIKFINSDTFSAFSTYLGMKGFEQNIEITKAAWTKGTIMHELCHAIGLYHEQCRADRDQYVNIDFSKMSADDRNQYKTYIERGENGADFGAFDFNSIMLYGSWLNGEVVMTKKTDGSTFYANRSWIANGDMLALAKLQPAINYTFYDPLGHNEPVDSPYEYIRSKYLRCPEKTNIVFRFQHSFRFDHNKLNGYSLNDFDVKAIITITNNRTGNCIYTKEIPLSETSGYEDLYLPSIEIPQGFYTAKLSLKGVVNGVSNSSKLDVLKWLMYNPMVYLHLNSVIIDNRNISIPNNSSDTDTKRLTFISIA